MGIVVLLLNAETDMSLDMMRSRVRRGAAPGEARLDAGLRDPVVEQLLLDRVHVEVGGGAQRGRRAAAEPPAGPPTGPPAGPPAAAHGQLARPRAPRPRRAGPVARLQQNNACSSSRPRMYRSVEPAVAAR